MQSVHGNKITIEPDKILLNDFEIDDPKLIDFFHELKVEEDETPDLIQTVMKKQQSEIPEWIQSILIWYEEDKVSEDELLNTIQYLVNEEILIL